VSDAVRTAPMGIDGVPVRRICAACPVWWCELSRYRDRGIRVWKGGQTQGLAVSAAIFLCC